LKSIIVATVALLLVATCCCGLYFLFEKDYIRLTLPFWKRQVSTSDTCSFSLDVESLELLDINGESVEVNVNQSLMLINDDYSIPGNFSAQISEYDDTDVIMNDAIQEGYAQLSQAVTNNCNDNLFVSSSYRTREHQQELYDELGPEIASVPGRSEHETGLALDVYVMYYAGMGFIDSEAGQFVNSNCGDYGFIIRYPRWGKEITGYAYEPWHIRFVGFPHSQVIMDNNYTLEEYIESFSIGVYYDVGSYLVARMPLDDVEIPNEYLSDLSSIVVSPDNTGYCFVTILISQ
ncbi:MAG TPA: M15 family metallopeptidase, partial [Saccharofermentans sp.]|nr:M15 family metallopeptidase [Saccharofermentans sp.]